MEGSDYPGTGRVECQAFDSIRLKISVEFAFVSNFDSIFDLYLAKGGTVTRPGWLLGRRRLKLDIR